MKENYTKSYFWRITIISVLMFVVSTVLIGDLLFSILNKQSNIYQIEAITYIVILSSLYIFLSSIIALSKIFYGTVKIKRVCKKLFFINILIIILMILGIVIRNIMIMV